MAQPRVLLADDHPLFREALSAAIARLRPDFEMGQIDSVAAARRELRMDPQIALLLLDLRLPDCDGLIGLLTLRAEFPHAPIVIVSAVDDALTASHAIAIGAIGFIPTSAPMGVISGALEAVLVGDVWTPPHLKLAAPSETVRALASLNAAQAHALSWARRGASTRRIAGELGVGEAEATAHLAAACRKLGVANRTQALGLVAAEYQAAPSAPA